MKYDHLQQQDPAVWEIIEKKKSGRTTEIELIASENYVSPAVLEAMATVLTNKYSEGYSGLNATMAAIIILTRLKIWRLKGLNNYLKLSMLMSSRCPVPRPMPPYIWLF